jgi:hypothetical protein
LTNASSESTSQTIQTIKDPKISVEVEVVDGVIQIAVWTVIEARDSEEDPVANEEVDLMNVVAAVEDSTIEEIMVVSKSTLEVVTEDQDRVVIIVLVVVVVLVQDQVIIRVLVVVFRRKKKMKALDIVHHLGRIILLRTRRDRTRDPLTVK